MPPHHADELFYTVRYFHRRDPGRIVHYVNTTVKFATIEGLHQESDYEISVRVQDAKGASDWSESLKITTGSGECCIWTI